MQLERRQFGLIECKLAAGGEAGTFTGYGAVFGNVDAYGDVIAAGAYTDSLAAHQAKGTMPKLFWQHNADEPIGRWLDAKEDDHGLLLRGKLNMDVQRGREAHALLKAGDIDGLSIGYRIKSYSVDTETGVWTLEKLDLVVVDLARGQVLDPEAILDRGDLAWADMVQRVLSRAAEKQSEREESDGR